MSTSSTAVVVNGCCFARRCRYRCRRVRSEGNHALRVTSPLRTVLCYCRKLLLKLSRARIFVAKHIYLLPPHSLNSPSPYPKCPPFQVLELLRGLVKVSSSVSRNYSTSHLSDMRGRGGGSANYEDLSFISAQFHAEVGR